MGRIGSCVPLQFISAALDPHCWKATSLADPEYVMDFTSPSAFCALAITVFASCAMAAPHRSTAQIAATLIFFNTVSPPPYPKTESDYFGNVSSLEKNGSTFI